MNPYAQYDPSAFGHHSMFPVPLMSLQIQPPPAPPINLRPQSPIRTELEYDENGDLEIPAVLKDVLDFKNRRAEEFGVDPNAITHLFADDSSLQKPVELDDSDEENEPTIDQKKKDSAKEKNKKKKLKKKKSKQRRREEKQDESDDDETEEPPATRVINVSGSGEDVEIEYVDEELKLDDKDPNYGYFAKVFEAFKINEVEESEAAVVEAVEEPMRKAFPKEPSRLEEDDDEAEKTQKELAAGDDKVSKRKLKQLTRPNIADLKANCARPDVVEWHDVTAKDPKLLVTLKAARNTVPVPRHWCFKRKYLAGKRGFEKAPFQLPDFIKKTGIMEMREALAEKEDSKTLKSKMREKVRPKLGKIDIDYQKLHDAFFRWQTKPRMTGMGELYFEGKEFETRLKEKKPGDLSEDLKTALGMPLGPNSNKYPPPWLIAMQRYGPPPSYPNLKIPGLNAPIPEGCSFGYHAGGWGKPPVDETGRPLYGDVFGMEMPLAHSQAEDDVDHSCWGGLESESEEESEEEESEEEGEGVEKEIDETGMQTPADGMATPSGLSSSVTAGLETPDTIELRKRKIAAELESGGDTPALYTVLPEKKVERIGGQMMASTHVYDISGTSAKKSGKDDGIEVALNPDELDIQDTAAMTAKYEETLKAQQSGKEEDFSDMVAEHVAKQKRKRKVQEEGKKPHHGGSEKKKYKEFKF